MFSLKHLRLREQRRQPLQKFAQKAPQPPALKPPSTARTAGRSDWAERRSRRQPFILLLVDASSISLVSAESGENSIIPLRLLFPPNPLRWASAGALFCPPQRRESPRKSAQKRLGIFLRGRDAAPPRRRPHSGLQGRTRGFCRLCRQLLLCAVTLGGHLREVQLVLIVLRQYLLHRQDRVEQ